MGTYDTPRGGPLSPNVEDIGPSTLVEEALELLESAGVPSQINDKIVGLIECWEKESLKDLVVGLERHVRCEKCGKHANVLLVGSDGTKCAACEVREDTATIKKARAKTMTELAMEAQCPIGSASSTPNLDYLREEVTQLKALLDDARPGLITWREAYGQRMKAIVDFWNGKE